MYGKNVIVKNDIGKQNARFLKGSLLNSTIEKGSIYTGIDIESFSILV